MSLHTEQAAFLWLAALAIVAALFLAVALANLGRAREIHHGYIGLFIAGIGAGLFASLAVPAWVGLVVMLVGDILAVDDAATHTFQTLQLWENRRVPPDWEISPVHKLAGWLGII